MKMLKQARRPSRPRREDLAFVRHSVTKASGLRPDLDLDDDHAHGRIGELREGVPGQVDRPLVRQPLAAGAPTHDQHRDALGAASPERRHGGPDGILSGSPSAFRRCGC